MTDIRLSDEDWGKIREFLRREPHAYLGRDENACRRFLGRGEVDEPQRRAMASAACRVWRVE